MNKVKFQDLLRQAESGDAEAQFELAACYEDGKGVKQDQTEAVKWYRCAADQGSARLNMFSVNVTPWAKA
ncbi:MAG: SEL1-like repeat protein [Rikenella sp.]|nr:SEL1-like repeat protein [Rikenella sp.]